MDIFTTLLLILFALTAIYYIVFFSFIYYWHLRKTSYVVVPVIFTFEFFAVGFFIICILALVIQYVPSLLKVAGINL